MTTSTYVIGEIAQAHDGSLGTAHSYIDAIADAGCDAAKFQMHIASEESTPEEPWRIKFSPQDGSRYEYWQRMEFTEEQWLDLKQHCTERSIDFVCSPFSLLAVERLKRIGVGAWKIASGEIANVQMLDAITETEQKILVSTGMSGWAEIDELVETLNKRRAKLTLMQCTSRYPTPANEVGLNVLAEYRNRYGCNVGLSDHSGKIYAGLAAAALGASALEVHVTWSKSSFGPDVSSSLDLAHLRLLVEGVREINLMQQAPVDKNRNEQQMSEMRRLFTKSIVLKQAIARGTMLTAEMICFKKPGTGISPQALSTVVGRVVNQDLTMNTIIREEHLV